MTIYDSPLWTLCERAAQLESMSDWQAITVDPIAGTVEVSESIADEVAYLNNPGTPHQTIGYSAGHDFADYVYRETAMHASNVLDGGYLFYHLFDRGDTLEPVTFQCVILDVHECDDCPPYDDDDAEPCESDHNAGWAFIYRRAVSESVPA